MVKEKLTSPANTAAKGATKDKVAASTAKKPEARIQGCSRPRSSSRHQRSSEQGSSDMPSVFMSMTRESTAPRSVKSTLTSKKDEDMASRQTQCKTLTATQRKEQEEWAQKKLEEIMPVLGDYDKWIRNAVGYHSKAGHHLITDEQLKEGKAGLYVVGAFDKKKGDVTVCWGPYYKSDLEFPDVFFYHGPEARDRRVPAWFQTADDAKTPEEERYYSTQVMRILAYRILRPGEDPNNIPPIGHTYPSTVGTFMLS